jgi:hypothetical protein
MKFFPLLFLAFIPTPVQSITWNEFWQPFTHNHVRYERSYVPMCNKKVYREQYVPGNYWRSGYVKRWTEIVKVPCNY